MLGKWLIDGHADSVFWASPPLEDVAVSSNLSGSPGRLTTPGASIVLSPEQSPFQASDADIGEREYGEDGGRRPSKVVPPVPLLPPVQFWLPGYPAYKLNYTAHHHPTGGATRSEAAGTSEDCQGGRWHHHHHRDRHASSVSSLSSSGLLDLCLNASTTTTAAAGVPRTWRAIVRKS
ncbi:hypothetical protein BGW80DRAFT_1464286 [Lactifluus volemus]|nr:hypothetical protein BGW80DRAFT_1464286 [Lactifluus volemus]